MNSTYLIISIIVLIILLLSFERTREVTLTLLLSPIGCLVWLGCGGCLIIVLAIVGAIFFGPIVIPIIANIITVVVTMAGRRMARQEILDALEEFFQF